MDSPLTLENRLILACARTDPDDRQILDLVEPGPDWRGILRKAERWGLAPLVYANLRQVAPSGQVPKSVTDSLRHIYHRDAIYGVAKRELLRVTLSRFSDASVPVIVLKDAALAALVYPSPALRPLGSIDLLVHGHDLDRVNELLRSMREAAGAPAVLSPDGFAHLHVRDHIAGPGSSTDQLAAAACIPIEDLWKRARPAQIESVATLVFSPADLLLHLALHLSETDGFVGHVISLCDIGETCRRYENAIDWRRLVTQAEAYAVGKHLYYALRVARDLVGAGVPARALAELRASSGRLPLEARFVAAVTRDAILSEDPATGPPSTYYTLSVHRLVARQARDGAMTACRLLARSCQIRLRGLVPWPRLWRARSIGSASSQPSRDAGLSAAPGAVASRQLGESTLPQTARPERRLLPPGEVAVTYDQHGASDGVGAQLQRIYGLYALSRALDIKYVHTPLEQVGYQGLMPMLTGRLDPDFVARYNAFFSLPSDDFDIEGCERIRIHNLSQATVEHYREQAAATGRSVLLQTLLPFAYIDNYPAAYHMLRAVSPYRGYRPAGPVRVCIHLRRGDNLPDKRGRWLPNSYYLRVCGTVLEALRQRGAPFVLRVHTEMPPRPYTIYPNTPGLYFCPEQPVTIDPAEYALEDFEALPNLEMLLNVEPQEAINDFATADVLILSASSFSYFGGLLNPHGLVVFAPFTWNSALPDWLVADEHGNLDAGVVATRIADLLRRRG